ncbi:MAG: TonB-dependent receptor [Alphaproteobacteria bacterium]|nr:TonB-dependent receptor [Alphaproteobacteria bacterium]
MPGTAQARQLSQISIPATTLDAALIILARETQIDVGSTEPGLRTVRTPAVKGRMSAGEALKRLLRATSYRAIEVDPRSFRIVRSLRRPQPPAQARAPRPSPPATLPARPASEDIVVTGSKQRVKLLRYPGSVTITRASPPPVADKASDMSEIARTMPVLQHTALGAGRNKVFIRGIADSSFNGAAQSTASTYFDDIQLAYSGAEPGLKLYDIAEIDVMEGPQGTLYGSGSIGGIIRLTSNPVDLNSLGGSLAGGATLTAAGNPGADLAGVVNMPIVAGSLGARLVAYRIVDGGYIDDPERGARHVNRTSTSGGRIRLRASPGDGWDIDLGGVGQTIDARDSQYAMRSVGPLSRRSALAQPFHNSVALGRLQVTKDWGDGLRLISASSIVGYRTDDVFDASPPGPNGIPLYRVAYHVRGAKRLLTHETRLSRSLPDGGSWVAGFTLLEDRDRLSRELGSPDNETSIIGVTNLTRSASLFGEWTAALSPKFAATLGARVTSARTDGEPSTQPRDDRFVRGRSTRRVDPTIAFSWLLQPRLALFGRYQSGFRTGGLAVAKGVGRVADFHSDAISVEELGLRRLRGGPTGLAFSTSVSLARWTGIQADLVNSRGLPYTANIGDAHIEAIEATGDWIPVEGLRLVGSLLYTHNKVSGPLALLSQPSRRHLPDTPEFAGRMTAAYGWTGPGEMSFQAELSANYVGSSVLGTSNLLDMRQGGYGLLGVTGRVKRRNIELSLTFDNITNSRGNVFAFGNPFALGSRDQVTPLRPANARLGVGVAW